MTISTSTKFKELILGTNSFADIFNGGRIVLYGGTQPLTANDAVLVPAIAEISAGGMVWAPGGGAAGLIYIVVGEWATKDTAQTWKMRGIIDGTPTWFRIYAAAEDIGSLSYSYARIDGSVSDTAGTDLTIPSTTIEAGSWLDIQQFIFTILPI